LLIGNFGEGNPVFMPITRRPAPSTLQNENGIEIDELWALAFGNGAPVAT
jgi:hypothetical protein